jgi:fatty-acyl-CoA synthase
MTTTPLPGGGMTISDQLSRHSRGIGHEVALVHGAVRRTYGELDERVGRLAAALRARGVRKGSRVAVLGPNAMEVFETYLATARLGALCVPLNFRLTSAELGFLLADSGARVLVVHASLAPLVADAGLDACLVFDGDPGGLPGREAYEHALAAASVGVEITVSDSDPAFLMYTSGTTGRPKGAVLTHRNLLINALGYLGQLGGHPDAHTVWLAATPLFHIAAIAGMLPTFLRGGRIVLTPPGRFDAAETVALMAREQVSSCFLVPSQWEEICARPDIAAHDLTSLRRLICGAAPASHSLIRTLVETFPQAEVTTGLAQTECGPVTTVLPGRDMLRKLGSVGKPMFTVEARVVDDEMRDVPRGTVGEIVYRGPSVMREYWNRPAETAAAFHGGWFHSGDLVRMDEDGYYYVVDRKTDMIISGGENIYCAELENVLSTHPSIDEVAVVGVPDPQWGEIPLVVVAGKAPPTLEEIRAWCAPHLATYKHPRRIAVVPKLPRNSTGKVTKAQLRAELAGNHPQG